MNGAETRSRHIVWYCKNGYHPKVFMLFNYEHLNSLETTQFKNMCFYEVIEVKQQLVSDFQPNWLSFSYHL